jgi:hypothetical protein
MSGGNTAAFFSGWQQSMAGSVNTGAYFRKPATDVISDIRTLSVPDYVLKDERALAMLAAFKALHPSEVSNADWSALCRFRARLKARPAAEAR